MREAFAAVKEALMSGNINQVASDFGCCQIPKDPYDQVMTCFDGHQALVRAVLFIFCFLKKIKYILFCDNFLFPLYAGNKLFEPLQSCEKESTALFQTCLQSFCDKHRTTVRYIIAFYCKVQLDGKMPKL